MRDVLFYDSCILQPACATVSHWSICRLYDPTGSQTKRALAVVSNEHAPHRLLPATFICLRKSHAWYESYKVFGACRGYCTATVPWVVPLGAHLPLWGFAGSVPRQLP